MSVRQTVGTAARAQTFAESRMRAVLRTGCYGNRPCGWLVHKTNDNNRFYVVTDKSKAELNSMVRDLGETETNYQDLDGVKTDKKCLFIYIYTGEEKEKKAVMARMNVGPHESLRMETLGDWSLCPFSVNY